MKNANNRKSTGNSLLDDRLREQPRPIEQYEVDLYAQDKGIVRYATVAGLIAVAVLLVAALVGLWIGANIALDEIISGQGAWK